MTETAIAWTGATDSAEAGADLGKQIVASLDGHHPDAVLLFSSPRYDHATLLQALDTTCRPGALVGCSSAGEFTNSIQGEGLTCAVALRSSEMAFSAIAGTGLSASRDRAAKQLAEGLKGLGRREYAYRTAIIFSDVLAGYTDALVEQLTLLTAGAYQFVGGGAGDDDRFAKTFVFRGTEVLTDAAVALEILSTKPIGIGVSHGWTPATEPMRVTEADGTRLFSLDAVPAVEVYEEHAERTQQKLDRANPVPFFLHNTLGIDVGGEQKLRVPLGTYPDGSLACASDVPPSATVRIMTTTDGAAAAAASRATASAVRQIGGNRPAVALFFDCVATRLRLGRAFGQELEAVRDGLGDVPFAGCNTYGQIARADGQFSGYHNCTAIVCVIPE